MNQHHPPACSTTPAPWFRALLSIAGFALAPAVFAQGVISSGVTGVLRDSSGKPVAGATVTATHVPTGTPYTAVSTDTGRYNFRGMIAGGPYTIAVSSPSIKPAEMTDVTTQLGQDIDVNFTLEPV